jgi:hypothetical protein
MILGKRDRDRRLLGRGGVLCAIGLHAAGRAETILEGARERVSAFLYSLLAAAALALMSDSLCVRVGLMYSCETQPLKKEREGEREERKRGVNCSRES